MKYKNTIILLLISSFSVSGQYDTNQKLSFNEIQETVIADLNEVYHYNFEERNIAVRVYEQSYMSDIYKILSSLNLDDGDYLVRTNAGNLGIRVNNTISVITSKHLIGFVEDTARSEMSSIQMLYSKKKVKRMLKKNHKRIKKILEQIQSGKAVKVNLA